MARIKVPFTGITSHSNHTDGECKNIVNLRPKNKFLKPVPPRKIIQELSEEYSIIFVHRGNDYENWIGVQGGDVYDIGASTPVLLYSTPPFSRNDGVPYTYNSIESVQQVGNTLSFVTRDSIFYALWDGTSYKFLGEMPECPNISFTTTGSDVFTKFSTYDGGTLIPRTKDTAFLNEYVKGVLAKLLSESKRFNDGFMIRWAFRLHNGDTVKASSPILVMPAKNYTQWGHVYLQYNASLDNWGPDSGITLYGFTLNMEYDFSFLANWSDIITSVDFFITPYSGIASADNMHEQSDFINGFPTDGVTYPVYEVFDKKIVIDKFESLSQFYLLYSETDFTHKTKQLPSEESTIKYNMQNIIYQELMENDSLSHHKYGSVNSSVFNNRLRLMDIQTTFFDGFPLDHFFWGSDYNGTSFTGSGTALLYVHVKLKLQTGERIVQRHRSVKTFLNAFISYPDPRAYEMDLYMMEAFPTPPPSYRYLKLLSIKLKPHPTLNIAYFLNEDLNPIIPGPISWDFTDPFIYDKVSLRERNKIKVSEVNNPFIFPNVNTYLIGSGDILAESSIIMNVSDRNYGLQSVFVFTTDGVFTMSGQTPDEVHDSIQAPTYMEPPISNVICATPYGVAFITKRGLMLISNDGTEFISPQLREEYDILNIDLTGITSPLITYPYIPFTSFLRVVTDMVYNPYDDELILAAKTQPYCYVYDFPSKTFYLSTERIDQVVRNTFPDVYIVAGTTLKDMSNYESNQANVSIITRPIQFGTTDIKKMERIFLRALMYNAHGVSVAAYHSVDGVHFNPIKGFTFGAGENYKDFDLGLLARETYRQYIFLLTGKMDDESQIEYVDYEVDTNYNNEKMR